MPRWIQTKSAIIPLFLMLTVGGTWWWITRTVIDDNVEEVRIEPEDLTNAVSDLEDALGRELTAEEQDRLLTQLVDDEILLDAGIKRAPWTTDPVVRRRLIQLVSFFDVGDRTADSTTQSRAALLKRAEHYDVQIDGVEFSLADALNERAE